MDKGWLLQYIPAFDVTSHKGGSMHKLLVAVCSMCLSASVVMAQGKVDSQWNCGKPTAGNSIDVGDQPGHAYAISQFNCTATKGEVEGVKEKDGVGTEFDDVKGNASRFHGVFVETLANGDKLYISYTGRAKLEKGQVLSASNAWSTTNGTGKVKGAKGKGTCNGKGNPDGSSTFDCAGDYTLAK
jgi:hypothetical protein